MEPQHPGGDRKHMIMVEWLPDIIYKDVVLPGAAYNNVVLPEAILLTCAFRK